MPGICCDRKDIQTEWVIAQKFNNNQFQQKYIMINA